MVLTFDHRDKKNGYRAKVANFTNSKVHRAKKGEDSESRAVIGRVTFATGREFIRIFDSRRYKVRGYFTGDITIIKESSYDRNEAA